MNAKLLCSLRKLSFTRQSCIFWKNKIWKLVPKLLFCAGGVETNQKNMQREGRAGKEGRREELRKDGEAAKSSKKKAFHAGGVEINQNINMQR